VRTPLRVAVTRAGRQGPRGYAEIVIRSLLVSALGDVVRIDLSGLDDDRVRAVQDAWRDALAADNVEADDGTPTVVPLTGLGVRAMLADLSQRVTLAALERARGKLWMLHAAGVALDDGRVVALIGPSGRGKTTAARTLGATFGYVSDETVAVARDGSALPYRKPLSVIEGEEPGAPKAQRAPGDLGLRPLPDAPLNLAGIVLLDRRPDAGEEAVVEDVELCDALTELVAQTSYLTALDAPLQTIADHVAAVGGIRRVIYREASSLVEVLPSLAEGGEVAEYRTATRVTMAPSTLDTPVYVRADAADAIEAVGDERLALLHVDETGQGTVRVLAGVAPVLWSTAGGATLEQLTDAAVAVHGEPEGDPTAAVTLALDELVEAGVLAFADPPAWRISDSVAWVDSGHRAVVLDLEDDACAPKALEESAALIWFTIADNPGTVDEIVARVAEEAGADAGVVAPDVVAFLDQLRESGWIAATAP